MNFKQLRQQKNRLAKELKGAIGLLQSEREENKSLSKKISYQNDINEILEKMLELETKAKNRVKLRLVAAAHARDKNYKNFINEVSKRNKREKKLVTALGVATGIIVVLVALLIKG